MTKKIVKRQWLFLFHRCGIPVIIMGETGCGKTHLIKFLCDLWKLPGSNMKNMLLMKVHGGTTADDIERKVKQAIHLAKVNIVSNVQTVLFFDEANTTEAIGLIKEIMCDRTLCGKPIQDTLGLHLIAACNPYRRHSDEMIRRLEQAGLGYHVQANETMDKFGRIPMRHLVYRVQALPQSMLPLVWDFGQLNQEVETLYIRQMVNKVMRDVLHFGNEVNDEIAQVISDILGSSQEFMRQRKDECSFVSLRDVDRTLRVMVWFYEKDELFEKMDERAVIMLEENNRINGNGDEVNYKPPENLIRALILALGVCYHARLQVREEYREYIARRFIYLLALVDGANTILENINLCQDVFLEEVLDLGVNIAKNQALKENLFMMVVCIELRIPLFLVGKPGSSKSLAKTIVSDAMQGNASRSELFRALKSVHMVSYQCSPLSTPEGIVGVFHQCAKLQEKQDLSKFVSVVVLDEVGLAEDSNRMPLKTLHPLLEDGCEGDEEAAPHKKVGFIGISNWALDPAKMNRGILVQRGIPDQQELEQTAKGICSSDANVARRIMGLIKPMSEAYLELYNSALEIREFFGLRDFYSLVKMVYGFTKRSNAVPTWYELKHAILRNFGGLENVRSLDVFGGHLKFINKDAPKLQSDPNSDPASLITASHSGEHLDNESRYLLVLTENYAALAILQTELLKLKDAIVIFGSSFPKDQEYTQVCLNINRIKICMETGRTIVLLNLENLYESLYDALNQYYVNFGDQRFVDLGLGTQRVKCRVHESFRLIVVAEKQIVYEKFPIPLINRLEKHYMAMSTMLTELEMGVSKRIIKWCEDFAGKTGNGNQTMKQLNVGDVIIGYHADAAASVVLQISRSTQQNTNYQMTTEEQSQMDEKLESFNADSIFEKAKDIFLSCATPESIVRMSQTVLAAQYPKVYENYFSEHKHDDILKFLQHNLSRDRLRKNFFVQLTTHSSILLHQDAFAIADNMNVSKRCVSLHNLNSFNTEQQFCRMIREYLSEKVPPCALGRLLLLQCDAGDMHADLIACARYNIWNEFCQLNSTSELTEEHTGKIHVVLIIQLPRIAGGCFVGFQGGHWMSYHIDDLHPHTERIPSLITLKDKSISSLFGAALISHCVSNEDASDQGKELVDVNIKSQFLLILNFNVAFF